MDINSLKGFTPGPWKVCDHPTEPCRITTGSWDSLQIAQVWMTDIVPENAALIAAAPELLELARMGLELAELTAKLEPIPERMIQSEVLRVISRAYKLLDKAREI